MQQRNEQLGFLSQGMGGWSRTTNRYRSVDYYSATEGSSISGFPLASQAFIPPSRSMTLV